MPLTSTSDGQFPAERTTDAQCIRDLAWQQERTDWIKENSLANLGEPKHVLPDWRLVTIYTELRRIQTKSPIIFSLHCNAVSEEKERVVYIKDNYIYIIFISHTTECIHGINSVVQ
jgi:hypothetical protein